MSDDFVLEPPPDDPKSRSERRRQMERKAIVIRGEDTLFNEASWQLFLEWIEDGRSVEEIDQSDLFPSWSTLRRWMRGNEDLTNQYWAARALSADVYESKIVQLLDQDLHKDDVPGAKLKFEIVKHLTSTRNPKRFGSKATHEVSGPDGGAVPITEIRRVIVHGDIKKEGS